MTAWGAIQLYWGILLALTCVVGVKGGVAMLRTALTLIVIGAVQFAFASWIVPFESIWHALFMLAADSLGAAIVLWNPAGKWQGVIGLSFALQITVHIG